MAHKRWKYHIADSLFHIALIISLLRTDITQYLTNYSNYPEVRQALLGHSVGLQVIGTSFRDERAYPSKYVNDSDYILSELNRLVSRTGPAAVVVRQYISTWLVTENGTSPLQVVPQSSRSNNVTAELSRQDIDLIESLWKQNTTLLDSGATTSTSFHTDLAESLTLEDGQPWEDSMTDMGTELAVPPPLPFKCEEAGYEQPFQIDSTQLLHNDNEPMPSTSYGGQPPYQHQNSLDLELESLPSLTENTTAYGSGYGNFFSNSNPCEEPEDLDAPLATNSSGMFSGSGDVCLPRYDADDMSLLNDTTGLEPSLLVDLEVDPAQPGLDIDFDTDDFLPNLNIRDSISEDSALSMGGSSPSQRSWSDRISESSDDLPGAVGFTEDVNCKNEPFDIDNGIFDLDFQPYEPVGQKCALRHDHTYAAPPGGVPHVRKMDIKVPKEPSRGLARDELMCRKLKIPFSVETIIDSAVDEFNSLLRKYPLSARQATLIRDIRRRGKNKVAAQNCRQKKIGEVGDLESEVQALREKRQKLSKRQSVLVRQTSDIRKHIDIMSAEIFATLRDENGRPYNTSQVTLEVGANGEITIAPVSSSTRQKRVNKKRRQQ